MLAARTVRDHAISTGVHFRPRSTRSRMRNVTGRRQQSHASLREPSRTGPIGGQGGNLRPVPTRSPMKDANRIQMYARRGCCGGPQQDSPALGSVAPLPSVPTSRRIRRADRLNPRRPGRENAAGRFGFRPTNSQAGADKGRMDGGGRLNGNTGRPRCENHTRRSGLTADLFGRCRQERLR